MARNRASMREGPLAELFRATEAAQRAAEGGGESSASEPELAEEHPTVVAMAPPSAPPDLPFEDEPDADPEREGRAARWLEPLPANPARLERGRGDLAYLAVIRVVGVGGAGLNALDRM